MDDDRKSPARDFFAFDGTGRMKVTLYMPLYAICLISPISPIR